MPSASAALTAPKRKNRREGWTTTGASSSLSRRSTHYFTP
jgi:hypothetical protein